VRDELADKNNALEQLEQLKDGLVQMVVHDMKNPITSMRGYLELMLEDHGDTLPQGVRKSMQICYESSERLLGMVRDLLDVSRLESGNLLMKWEI